MAFPFDPSYELTKKLPSVRDIAEILAGALKRLPASAIILLLLSGPSVVASDLGDKVSGSGPIYVPLDSWVYPALSRLAALGYLPDAENLVKPWTCAECLILVNEAVDIASRHSVKVMNGATNEQVKSLIASLQLEFREEA